MRLANRLSVVFRGVGEATGDKEGMRGKKVDEEVSLGFRVWKSNKCDGKQPS